MGAGQVALEGLRERIVLVGNPNVGKSVFFGALTGRYAIVSNYPGTTVEVSSGTGRIGGRPAHVVDTPGMNSLLPRSEDERVTRDILLDEPRPTVIQVADAKNLARALVLTTELGECGLPMVLALNMWDEALERGIRIDTARLSSILGVPVVATIATQRKGFPDLFSTLASATKPTVIVPYGDDVEEAVRRISELLPENLGIAPRAAALMLLAGDEGLRARLQPRLMEARAKEIEGIRGPLASQYASPLFYVISRQRQQKIDEIMEEVFQPAPRRGTTGAPAFLGRLAMHPVWGIPILLAALYLTYLFVGSLGAGRAVDFLEGVVFERWLLPPFAHVVQRYVPTNFLREMIAGEFGIVTMGIKYSVAIVLPIVGFFFLAFGLMEDSGYLPRIAVLLNRLFAKMGLSGKAVLPMVLGLGCDTMATLTTRILPSRKERLIATLLLALAIPCSAQLGAISGLLVRLAGGSAIPWPLIIWGGTVFAQLVIVGYFASRILPGEDPNFLMEIPPIRAPEIRNVVVKTVYRIHWFLREAVPLFVLGTFVLFLMDRWGALRALEAVGRPVVAGLLGLPQKAARIFLMGFLRRDYAAAGLTSIASELSATQIMVSLVVITLFVPCIANFFVIVKEQGGRRAAAIAAFIIPYAIAVGAVLRVILDAFSFGG
ncbi:MAG: ferrous iron transport protein B [Planctomycetota bacterium]